MDSMDSTVIEQIERLLERNQSLIQMMELEEWQRFTPEVEDYSRQLNALSLVDLTLLEAEMRALVTLRLETLLAQDAVLMQGIRSRLAELSKEMAGMRKSNVSAQAYRAV